MESLVGLIAGIGLINFFVLTLIIAKLQFIEVLIKVLLEGKEE